MEFWQCKGTLLEWYGPQFENYHEEGCTCPSPQTLLVYEYTGLKHITLRCNYCGLRIRAREVEEI